ncbi:MAG: SEC-C domain-containing protein [Solirubrobacteraceae bacterium]|nr:SEC-C domain-containing protein [Solirubrobacteraceae bacterium]
MTSTPREPTDCPCGSGETYRSCCRRLHRGRRLGLVTAPTAERLMRSRYAAFAVGDATYLVETWHPSTRPPTLRLDDDVEWCGLDVVGATGGGEDDVVGTVEFVAHHRRVGGRRTGRQREDSLFRREAGQWFYVGPTR